MSAIVFYPNLCHHAKRSYGAAAGTWRPRRVDPASLWKSRAPEGARVVEWGRALVSLWDAPYEVVSLVRRCNGGDERAWEQFYGRYVGMVSRVARRYSTHVSRDHEDLVQEVFIHIFKALRDYDATRPLDPFVLEITRNVCISGLRHDAAEKRGGANPGRLSVDPHDAADDGSALVLPSDADNAETALIKAQEARLVRHALSRLSDACRKLLGLRYERGLSYAEMSEASDVRQGTLRVQVLRCLSALGREYGRLVDREAVR